MHNEQVVTAEEPHQTSASHLLTTCSLFSSGPCKDQIMDKVFVLTTDYYNNYRQLLVTSFALALKWEFTLKPG